MQEYSLNMGAATNGYFLCEVICRYYCQFIVWSIKCQKNGKIWLTQLPRALADIFIFLVVSNQQSKTPRYLVYNYIKQIT